MLGKKAPGVSVPIRGLFNLTNLDYVHLSDAEGFPVSVPIRGLFNLTMPFCLFVINTLGTVSVPIRGLFNLTIWLM